MNEEIDEFDIYHQDFTTASEWEVFIARIEEILTDWGLSKSKYLEIFYNVDYTETWKEKVEEIKFYGATFVLSYHYLEPRQIKINKVTDVNDTNNLSKQIFQNLFQASMQFVDDCSENRSPFPVSSWYGLKQFVMLTPKQPLIEEDQIKLILSSINIASGNVDSAVPIFVKIRDQWQQNFQGVFEDGDNKTFFDVIHLKRIPNQCYHLSGLLNLFKGKLASPNPLDPILMSAKFTYQLVLDEKKAWRKSSKVNFYTDDFDIEKWSEYTFGAKQDPISSAFLHVMWPKFYEDAVIDSPTYSDFDPLMAPNWTVSVEMEKNLKCSMSSTCLNILDLMSNDSYLMDIIGLSKILGIVNPLHKITDNKMTISKLVKVAIGSPQTQCTEFKGPIFDEQLMALLYYIFPDAVEDSAYGYPESLDVEFKQVTSNVWKESMKKEPSDSLVWRLSKTVSRLLEVGGLQFVAHFWYEFTQELQYRWEHNILIPGVAPGMPNARTCLLHQKLQLLNCCIEKARSQVDSSSDDEEFYDCSDEGEDCVPDRPMGRLEELPGAKLKNGAPLYVPKTQDPAPKTEDQLDEDAELMLRLGDNPKASELRAKMMSASLLSDMEAFKAANLGAELCDFVQWYSPRDWLPENGGTLGERMLLPDNPWVEAWANARPVPAARQRRLFDEKREAERVLHYLRSITVSQFAELVLPVFLRISCGPAVDRRRVFEARVRELYETECEYAREERMNVVLGSARPGRLLQADERRALSSAVSVPTHSREFVLRAHTSQHVCHIMRALLSNEIMLISAFTENMVLV